MSEATVRLVVAHAAVTGAGVIFALVGIAMSQPHWLLAAGPCLMLSGVLILLGSRITFRGPTGDLLRAVLGPARVRRLNLRALVWIVAGVLVCLWGFRQLRQAREFERPWVEPLAARSSTTDI